MARRQIQTIKPIAEGIDFVEGPESNWVLIHDATRVSLIDTGYPADYDLVLESIRAVGKQPDDLELILITHGHSDHIGNAAKLSEQFGARVLCHQLELPNVHRTELHQVGVRDALRKLFSFGVLRWSLRAISSGGLTDVQTSAAEPFDSREMIRISGRQVMTVVTAGHTPGHCAYWFERAQVLVTGDALVSAHPTLKAFGLQILPRMFHANYSAAIDSLGELALTSPVTVLPGHGPAVTVEAGFTNILAAAATDFSRRRRPSKANASREAARRKTGSGRVVREL